MIYSTYFSNMTSDRITNLSWIFFAFLLRKGSLDISGSSLRDVITHTAWLRQVHWETSWPRLQWLKDRYAIQECSIGDLEKRHCYMPSSKEDGYPVKKEINFLCDGAVQETRLAKISFPTLPPQNNKIATMYIVS